MRAIRNCLMLTCATALAACGGDTGPQAVGNVAPPTGSSPAPTHSFVNPTEPKTYAALGGVQHYEYHTDSNKVGQGGQLYAGDANTSRDSGISVTYNPRDAIFELTISRPKGLVTVDAFRFQDPAHRTDFLGAKRPQAGVPQLAAANVQYLQAGSSTGALMNPRDSGAAQSDYAVGMPGYSSTTQTLFYQKPGTTTNYVTYAGYVRNTLSTTEMQDTPTGPLFRRYNYSIDRAAFVFGEQTSNSAVPRTGAGAYAGEMIATMVVNPMLDIDPSFPTYFQWIQGTHTTTVDFATLAVSSKFAGTVTSPARDAYTTGDFVLPDGTAFSASANATIDLVNKGGFTGQFTEACFAVTCTDANKLLIAGSSIDGAFYGPKAEEVGGGFRIVGGKPDQRIDILGAFTGKK